MMKMRDPFPNLYGFLDRYLFEYKESSIIPDNELIQHIKYDITEVVSKAIVIVTPYIQMWDRKGCYLGKLQGVPFILTEEFLYDISREGLGEICREEVINFIKDLYKIVVRDYEYKHSEEPYSGIVILVDKQELYNNLY